MFKMVLKQIFLRSLKYIGFLEKKSSKFTFYGIRETSEWAKRIISIALFSINTVL